VFHGACSPIFESMWARLFNVGVESAPDSIERFTDTDRIAFGCPQFNQKKSMQASAQIAFDDASFSAFLASRQEPEWLATQRRQAWQAFGELDWPNRSHEEWLRTDIRMFGLQRYGLDSSPPESVELPQPQLAAGIELGGATVSLDSSSVKSQCEARWQERGVLFGDLGKLVSAHPEKIQPHLMRRAFDVNYDRFAALHGAWWSGGTLLYVPRGVVVDEPFHAFSAITDGGVDLGHTLVILEEGAEATLLSETASLNPTAGGMHCGGVELVVGAGANLRYVNLQDWATGVWHFSHQKAVLGQDANLQWTIAAMGSRLAKVNQHVGMVGPGANCQVNGVMFAEGRQHLSYHTLQHHEVASCHSDFLYKTALQDRARTVWRGMIKVDPQAQRTDGYQRNDNLLLSTSARADSIPGLEIEADDVRCTHGSTTGKIDEELIFYAMCRGFSRREAVRMIVTGFFQKIFDRITIDSVRQALGLAIARKVREYD